MKFKRKKAYRAGMRAELMATLYLMAKGYRVLARRYKTPVGEIDLVVVRRDRLVFVEVKARRSSIEALYAVTPTQQKRIRRAASHWLAKNDQAYNCEMGFDVVAVRPWTLPRHIKNAFSHAFH